MVMEGRRRAQGGRRTRDLHRRRRREVPVLGRTRSGARLATGAAVRSGLVDVAARPGLEGRSPAAELGSSTRVITRPCGKPLPEGRSIRPFSANGIGGSYG